VAAVLAAGISVDAPSFAAALSTREAVFVPGWQAEHEGVAGTKNYGAGAFYPCLVGDAPQGLLAMGTQRAGDWTLRECQVFRAVGRSLMLALERSEQAQRLTAQNAELEARTRALEGFAELTRHLGVETDRYALVKRAEEVVMSLLSEGYALYYEREHGLWRNRVQTGALGLEAGQVTALQEVVDAGFPYDVPQSLVVPWTTGDAFYQDEYLRGGDTDAALVQHVSTVASLPIQVRNETVGVVAFVLFGARRWTRTDKAVMETVVRSLGLALERAEDVADLAQRTQELERSNAELEQFAYIASHDLQAPIRAVTSFAGIIRKRYGEGLDERGQLYLQQIVDSGEHMKRLVDDLLSFSRVHTEQRPFFPTDAEEVFDVVASRLQGQVPGAAITRGALPVVQADAQQLDQLLQNLIANGLKYHREGGVPEVKVSAQREGERWHFAVEDNGIGIEPQYFERIFVIFQRLHGRDAYEGTGISLAVCKKIVERHGGRIWLESVPGQGTTFHFTLPEG
jgi:signal transduction histidine kinase